jgi:DNA-binding transcriptional LysR family regulator
MRVFQQVVDDGSFAAAARKFDMSSAVVTRLVGDLEDHLGVRLLQRTTRRLALTDAGETYLARVRHILSDIDEAHAAAQAHAQEMSGTIRIMTPPVFAVHVLAPLVAEFGRRYPKVVLDIHVDSPLVPPVEDYDLTLLGAGDTFDANIIARPIASSDGVLCASPDYLRRNGMPERPEDLPQHHCLRVKQAANRHRVWRLTNPNEGKRVIEVQIEPSMLVNHSDTLIRACVDGAGIMSQSIDLVANHLNSGALQRILSPWITGTNTLYAALPSRKFIPVRTSVFLEFMTEYTRRVIKKMDARQD